MKSRNTEGGQMTSEMTAALERPVAGHVLEADLAAGRSVTFGGERVGGASGSPAAEVGGGSGMGFMRKPAVPGRYRAACRSVVA